MRKAQKLAQQREDFKAARKERPRQRVPDRLLSHANLSQRAKQNLSLSSTPNTFNSDARTHAWLTGGSPHPTHVGCQASQGSLFTHRDLLLLTEVPRVANGILHPCFFKVTQDSCWDARSPCFRANKQ